MDAEDLAVWLLTDFNNPDGTVMVAPASGFYLGVLGRSEVRIAYVLKEEDLRTAVRLLARALEQYPGRVASE